MEPAVCAGSATLQMHPYAQQHLGVVDPHVQPDPTCGARWLQARDSGAA